MNQPEKAKNIDEPHKYKIDKANYINISESRKINACFRRWYLKQVHKLWWLTKQWAESYKIDGYPLVIKHPPLIANFLIKDLKPLSLGIFNCHVWFPEKFHCRWLARPRATTTAPAASPNAWVRAVGRWARWARPTREGGSPITSENELN